MNNLKFSVTSKCEFFNNKKNSKKFANSCKKKDTLNEQTLSTPTNKSKNACLNSATKSITHRIWAKVVLKFLNIYIYTLKNEIENEDPRAAFSRSFFPRPQQPSHLRTQIMTTFQNLFDYINKLKIQNFNKFSWKRPRPKLLFLLALNPLTTYRLYIYTTYMTHWQSFWKDEKYLWF